MKAEHEANSAARSLEGSSIYLSSDLLRVLEVQVIFYRWLFQLFWITWQ